MHPRYYILIISGLFLPTLAVGLLALALLVREQDRINELAVESATANALTVAENASLLMAEIKTGVMESLQAASGDGNESARLVELVNLDPFVEAAYIWEPSGGETFTLQFSTAQGKRLPESFNLSEPPWREQITKNRLSAADIESLDQLQQREETSGYGGESQALLPQAQSKRSIIREFSQQNAIVLNELRRSEARERENYKTNRRYNLGASVSEAIPNLGKTGWLVDAGDGLSFLAWNQIQEGGRVTGALLSFDYARGQIEGVVSGSRSRSPTMRIRSPEASYRSINVGDLSIPLGEELPGWYLDYPQESLIAGDGILFLGAALIVVLCFASIGSGSLILLRARREARESAHKTTFVSNVSHELRTPLTTIRMYAEMLEEGRVSNEEKRVRYLRTVASESQRLSRLVSRILDFNHLEKGNKTYDLKHINIVGTIQSALRTMEQRIQEHGMDLDWSPPQVEQVVWGDHDALEQVLINLLDNVLKYARDGGYVGVRLKRDSENTRVIILDRGPGIPRADRKRIFSAFERVDDRLVAREPGFGLGLSISVGIARAMGGDLTLQTAKPQGAQLTISLINKAPSNTV